MACITVSTSAEGQPWDLIFVVFFYFLIHILICELFSGERKARYLDRNRFCCPLFTFWLLLTSEGTIQLSVAGKSFCHL